MPLIFYVIGFLLSIVLLMCAGYFYMKKGLENKHSPNKELVNFMYTTFILTTFVGVSFISGTLCVICYGPEITRTLAFIEVAGLCFGSFLTFLGLANYVKWTWIFAKAQCDCGSGKKFNSCCMNKTKD
jgi:hypothetical protein